MQSSLYPKTSPLLDKDCEETDLEKLVHRKNLDMQAFAAGEIKLSESIAKHAARLFKYIYSKPYPEHKVAEGIARQFHGIQHVGRAALYIPILANLYRRYQDAEALKLTDEDLHLIQIATLFHDSAREKEDEDYWDRESAALLYHYLTKALNVPEEKALQLANAIANKDCELKGYFELKKNHNGELHWEKQYVVPEKTIWQKLIHDADCLDIIRARDAFSQKYLNFYQQIGIHNPKAFDEMSQLITEIRSMIAIQGDSFRNTKFHIKREFEHSNAYQTIETCLHQPHYLIALRLYGQGRVLSEDELQKDLLDTTPYDASKPLDVNNLRAAMREFKVFARSVATPSAIRAKKRKKESKESKTHENLTHLEIYKGSRIPNEPSRSGRHGKDGNEKRSVSALGWGATTYANVSLLLVDPNVEQIQQISEINTASGTNKKNNLVLDELSAVEKQERLKELMRNQKMGGSAYHITGSQFAATHSEIIYHIKPKKGDKAALFDAVIYSPDPNFYNSHNYNNPEAVHKHSAALQAIFVQNEYKNMTNKTLPLFLYSGTHNLVEEKKFTDADVENMWLEMCSDYMKKELSHGGCQTILFDSIDDIKVKSMYHKKENKRAAYNASADANYPPDFQNKLSKMIANERDRLISEDKKQVSIDIKMQSVLHEPLYSKLLNYSEFHNDMELQDVVSRQIRHVLNSPYTYFKFHISEIEAYLQNPDEIFQLIYNKKDYLKSTNAHRSHYFDEQLVKCYELASVMQLQEISESIQDRAESLAQQLFNCLKQSNTVTFKQNLLKFLSFVGTYDIFDKFKVDLLSLCSSFFQLSVSEPNWDFFVSCVETFDQFNFLQSQDKDTLNRMIPIFAEAMNNKTSDNQLKTLSCYLRLAAVLKIPLSVQKEMTYQCLRNTKDTFTMGSRLFALAKSGLLMDEKLFQVVINKIDGIAGMPLVSSFDHIKSLCEKMESVLPNGQFTSVQLSVINKFMLEKAKLFFKSARDQLKATHSAEDLVCCLTLAKHAGHSLKEKLDLFHEWLTHHKGDYIAPNDFLPLVNTSIIPSALNDAYIFESIIQKIPYSPSNHKVGLEIDRDAFNYHVEQLRQRLPRKRFNSQQLDVIQKRWNNIAAMKISKEAIVKEFKTNFQGHGWWDKQAAKNLFEKIMQPDVGDHACFLLIKEYIASNPRSTLSKKLNQFMENHQKEAAIEKRNLNLMG